MIRVTKFVTAVTEVLPIEHTNSGPDNGCDQVLPTAEKIAEFPLKNCRFQVAFFLFWENTKVLSLEMSAIIVIEV